MSSFPKNLFPANVTLAILAGGEGSRMGLPKGAITIASQPILEYLLGKLSWPGPTMLVTAPGREHPPGYQQFDSEALDPTPGGGPLRGMLTAMENAATSMLLVLTVDMPAVRRANLDLLLQRLATDPAMMGVMYRRPGDGASKIEPFPCALRLSAKPVIARRLAENRRSIHSLLGEPNFGTLDAPADWAERVWTNLNTPADLDSFVKGERQEPG